MWVSRIKEEDLTFDLIDRLLFQGLADTGEPVDCILVLGSAKAAQYRVPVAAAAYHAGRAGRIMLCGGVLLELPEGRCSEAALMYKAALDLGVPESAVILEDASQSTVENILFALIGLQRAFYLNNVHRVLLVTAAYHMRRSLAVARYLFPDHIEIVPCPTNDSTTRRDNWMHTPESIARVRGEAMNIVRCVVNGVIPDFEI